MAKGEFIASPGETEDVLGIREYISAGGTDRAERALELFFEHWSEIAELIFRAPSYSDAMTALIARFGFRQLDVHFILSVPLGSMVAEGRQGVQGLIKDEG